MPVKFRLFPWKGLLFMWVYAVEGGTYKKDLELIKQFYYATFRYAGYSKEAETHMPMDDRNGALFLVGNALFDKIWHTFVPF